MDEITPPAPLPSPAALPAPGPGFWGPQHQLNLRVPGGCGHPNLRPPSPKKAPFVPLSKAGVMIQLMQSQPGRKHFMGSSLNI